jgi:hypothetical protein
MSTLVSLVEGAVVLATYEGDIPRAGDFVCR